MKRLFIILSLLEALILYKLIKTVTPESHTMEEWARMKDRVSVKNKWYVVSDFRTDEATNIPRFKFGDGKTPISQLPFCTAAITDNDVDKWDVNAENM